MFDFSNYSAKSKYYDDSNKLVVGKVKEEAVGVSIEKFVGLKPKMYSSEHVNKNAIAKPWFVYWIINVFEVFNENNLN